MPKQTHDQKPLVFISSVIHNATEIASFSLLVAILLYLQRQHQSYVERSLLQAVGNPGFSPACAAVMQLYREGRLSGEKSVLRGKNLMGANWQRAVLREVDLEGANLQHADLRDALLEYANLEKCDFRHANFSGANLAGTRIVRANFMRADLKQANLSMAKASRASFFMARGQRAVMRSIRLDHADLQEADLHGANLEGADLTKTSLLDTNLPKANLKGANLEGAMLINANLLGSNVAKAYFDENTVLPDAKWVGFADDGRRLFDKYWTPDTDMTRYTNPWHADFWEPEWVQKYEWVQKNYEED